MEKSIEKTYQYYIIDMGIQHLNREFRRFDEYNEHWMNADYEDEESIEYRTKDGGRVDPRESYFTPEAAEGRAYRQFLREYIKHYSLYLDLSKDLLYRNQENVVYLKTFYGKENAKYKRLISNLGTTILSILDAQSDFYEKFIKITSEKFRINYGEQLFAEALEKNYSYIKTLLNIVSLLDGYDTLGNKIKDFSSKIAVVYNKFKSEYNISVAKKKDEDKYFFRFSIVSSRYKRLPEFNSLGKNDIRFFWTEEDYFPLCKDIKTCNLYLEKFDYGKHKEEVLLIRQKLEKDADKAFLEINRDIEKCDDFLKKHRGSRHEKEVIDIRTDIEFEADKKLFEKCIDIESCKKYIHENPLGFHVVEAHKKLELFEAEKRRDDEICKVAESITSINAIKRALKKYGKDSSNGVLDTSCYFLCSKRNDFLEYLQIFPEGKYKEAALENSRTFWQKLKDSF